MWVQKGYFVYIMSSQRRVLYVGITNNLPLRVWQHQTRVLEGSTSRYNITQLVYYESFDDVHKAIPSREGDQRLGQAEEDRADRKCKSQVERLEHRVVQPAVGRKAAQDFRLKKPYGAEGGLSRSFARARSPAVAGSLARFRMTVE
jgi:putative endonuclease